MLLGLPQLAGFAAASIVVILAPGPDNLGTLGIGLSRGRRAAVAFAAGCALGCLTHTGWAALGVAALIKASPTAFTFLKVVGAGYLVYLGVLALRSRGAAVDDTAAAPVSSRRYLLRGFIANAVNPKVAIFFLAFFPQFVHDTGHAALQMIALGIVFATMTLLVFGAIGLFAGTIGGLLRTRPTAARRLDQLAGLIFIALAVWLLIPTPAND